MAETTTGQAIALGNIARPDTTKVFTQAVMRKQEMDLRKKKLAQDEAAKQKQLQAEFAKMLDFGKGGFLPMYQEQATEITSAANAEMYRRQKEGDIIGASAVRQQAKRSLEDLEQENNQFKAWLSTSRQGGLIPQEVLQISSMPFSQAQQEYQKLVVNKPEMKEVFDIDSKNKRPVFYPTKEVNYNTILNSTTSNLLANSSTPIYSKAGELIRYDYKVDDNIVASRANELAADNDLRVNVIVTRPQEYKSQFDKVVAENKYDINNPVQRDLAKAMAVRNVIQNDIKVGIDKVRFVNAPKDGKGGDGDQIITTAGGGGGNIVPIKTKQFIGYEVNIVDGKAVTDYNKPLPPKYVDENVNAGQRRSFNTVKILAGKGENYLDLDVNERMGGQAIQETEIGNIRVYPIATEDVKVNIGTKDNPKYYVRVKKGDVIPESEEKLAKTKGLLRFEPRFEGIAITKDNIRGEIRKSVLVDLNEAYGAVRSSQTKDDVPLVDLQVKEAQAEANRLNSGLPRLKAATTAPKTEAPKGKGAAKETKVAGKVNNKL